MDLGEIISKSKWSIFLRLELCCVYVINGYFHICMEVKTSVLGKRTQPVSHGACRFVFSLAASAIIFLPRVCSASVELGGRLPLWLQQRKISLH